MKLQIAYACNGAYVTQTMVSMASLFEHHRNEEMAVYLVEDGVGQKDLERFGCLAKKYAKQFCSIPLRQVLAGFPVQGDGRHPVTVYAKLFLDQICMADRILYLDSDTVVTGPLLPLWEMELGDALAAGVKMPYNIRVKSRLGLSAKDIYVCDGIVLIHLEKWRDEGVSQKCAALMSEGQGLPYMLSEGVLNQVCRGRILPLHPKYNLMAGMILWNASQISELYNVNGYYSDGEIAEANRHPVIIHYLNELYIRPWFQNSDHPYREEYRVYCRTWATVPKMPRGRLKQRTRILRICNALLPFQLFVRLYRLVKRMDL